ncbi:MAG: PilZ domain-containing protein [Pseudomonadota bacterium]
MIANTSTNTSTSTDTIAANDAGADTGSDGSTDRRNQKRLPVEMWVDEMQGSSCYFQRSANLSLGGMYLDGTIPHPRGTVVQLRFTLPGEDQPIDLRGEVVGEPDPDRLGMHVRFLDTAGNESVRHRLEAFLCR